MPVEWCQPCKARGKLSIARHDVKCTLMCDGCFSGRESRGVPIALMTREPVRKIEEAKVGMQGRKIDDETRKAILADAAGGLSVEQCRVKHNVGWITAKNIIGGGGAKPGAGPKKLGRPRKNAPTTAVVVAEPAAAVTVTPAKADAPDNRVRFILLDAEISSGGLAELTNTLVEALKK